MNRPISERGCIRTRRQRWLALIASVLLVTVFLPAGDGRVDANAASASEQQTSAWSQEFAGSCPAELAASNRVCPAPDDAGYLYITSITSYAASNGIAVMFTDAGMELAVSCQGAGELATIIARMFAQLPSNERAEKRIDWAVPQMTGEITGHARVYAAASNERVRDAANPVNIVFPEYQGTFQEGIDGINAWAQQVYYGSLCQ